MLTVKRAVLKRRCDDEDHDEKKHDMTQALRAQKEPACGGERKLNEREYESVMQLIGAMSQKHCAEPAAFERANYMKMLQSYRPLN